MNMYSGGLTTLAMVDVVKPDHADGSRAHPKRRADHGRGDRVGADPAGELPPRLPEPPVHGPILHDPWTAVNLIDSFFVRKEKYAIREMFKPNGI